MKSILLATTILATTPALAETPVAAPTASAQPPAVSAPPTTAIPTAPPILHRYRPPSASELRVRAANRTATLEPAASGYLNAVQVYPYAEGALFHVFTAPGQVTDIALQPGETLGAVAAGDTVRWVIGDTSSGSGDAKRTHVLVKPFASGLATNVVITTDRRTYHLSLTSTERTAMAALSWTYPQDALIALRARNAEAAAAAPVATGVDVATLNFRYRIDGDNAPWKPLRAFDDGRKVYIEFPAGISQGEMPPLFVIGAAGNAELVNYRVQGRYMVVDRLFAAAELRLGDKHSEQHVRIERDDGRKGRP